MNKREIILEKLLYAVDESTDVFGANVDKYHLTSLFKDIIYEHFKDFR